MKAAEGTTKCHALGWWVQRSANMKAGYHADIEMLREKTHYSLEDYRLWMLQAGGPLNAW